MSTEEPQLQPSEEELRAAYEAQIKKLRVEHVLLEDLVTLVNLGMRRTGLAPGAEDERDLGQVRLAIEAIRALLPIVEQVAPQQVGPLREALSQLQLAFVRVGGQPGAPGASPGASREPGAAGQPGAAGTSGQPGAGQPEAPGAGQPGAGAPSQSPPPPKPGEPGPAQRSGRLWVPGQ